MESVRIRSYSGPHFPVFALNRERYSVSLRIQSKCGKIRTRITPNTDTFYAVYAPSFHCVMVLNMGVSEFLDFVLHFSIVISCLLKRVVSYFNVHTKLEVIV